MKQLGGARLGVARHGKARQGKDIMKTIPSRSIESQLIEKRLLELTENEVVTYEELESITSLDRRTLQQRAMPVRWQVLRDHQVCIQCVHKVGYKRANNAEKLAGGVQAIRRVRKMARKGIQIHSSVDYDALSDGEKVTHNTQVSVLAVLGRLTDKKRRDKIAAAVEKADGQIPFGGTMKLFEK